MLPPFVTLLVLMSGGAQVTDALTLRTEEWPLVLERLEALDARDRQAVGEQLLLYRPPATPRSTGWARALRTASIHSRWYALVTGDSLGGMPDTARARYMAAVRQLRNARHRDWETQRRLRVEDAPAAYGDNMPTNTMADMQQTWGALPDEELAIDEEANPVEGDYRAAFRSGSCTQCALSDNLTPGCYYKCTSCHEREVHVRCVGHDWPSPHGGQCSICDHEGALSPEDGGEDDPVSLVAVAQCPLL
jgi:hypothetical protein